MLVSISEIGYSNEKNPAARKYEVVTVQLDPQSETLGDALTYLDELQTIVYVHRDVMVKRDNVLNPIIAYDRQTQVFIVGRDVAALFRLHYDFTVIHEAEMWLKPTRYGQRDGNG